MGATEPVRFTGQSGAGFYGGPPHSHVTTCVNSRNPHGHNPECRCGWKARERASQTVPYVEPVEAELHTFFGYGEA